MSNTSYSQYIENIAGQFAQLSGMTPRILPLVKPAGLSDKPRILILAPHPDDECLMAGYALRAQEEWGAIVTVVPFSFGSHVARQNARAEELKKAVAALGFHLFPQSNFEESVRVLNPEIIISPHERDRHPTHIAAAETVKSFLSSHKNKITWIKTEYWQASEKPNYFLPLSTAHVVKIGEALMEHEGEIVRNPYHLSLPAWYMDQARRAPEVLAAHFGLNPNSKTDSGIIFGQLLEIVSQTG